MLYNLCKVIAHIIQALYWRLSNLNQLHDSTGIQMTFQAISSFHNTLHGKCIEYRVNVGYSCFSAL